MAVLTRLTLVCCALILALTSGCGSGKKKQGEFCQQSSECAGGLTCVANTCIQLSQVPDGSNTGDEDATGPGDGSSDSPTGSEDAQFPTTDVEVDGGEGDQTPDDADTSLTGADTPSDLDGTGDVRSDVTDDSGAEDLSGGDDGTTPGDDISDSTTNSDGGDVESNDAGTSDDALPGDQGAVDGTGTSDSDDTDAQGSGDANADGDDAGADQISQKPTIPTCGDITVDTTWTADSIWLVTCRINVLQNAVLTIEPGTLVLFESETAIGFNDGAALVADGTQTPIVMRAEIGGVKWEGLRFLDGADGSKTVLKFVEITDAGNSSPLSSRHASVVFQNVSNVVFENNKVIDSDTVGVSLTGFSRPASFVNNLVKDSLNAPIEIRAEHAHRIGVGTYNSKTVSDNVIELYGTADDLDESGTWLNHGIPYRFGDRLTIQGKAANALAVLTIADGTRIRFKANGAFQIDQFAGLIADGTDIVMEADTQSKWEGLRFNGALGSQVKLVGLTVRDAGNLNVHTSRSGAIVFEDMDEGIILENSVIVGSENDGVAFIRAFPLDGRFKNNQIYGNDSYPIFIYAEHVHRLGGNNTFVNPVGGGDPNTLQSIRIPASDALAPNRDLISNPGVFRWIDHKIPYLVASRVRVIGQPTSSPSVLILEAGVEVRFDNGTGYMLIGSNAGLKVEGTSESPVVLSNHEQANWSGLRFNDANGADIDLDYLVILNGGAVGSTATTEVGSLVFQGINGPFTLDHVTVDGGPSYGIVFDSAKVGGNSFTYTVVKNKSSHVPLALSVEDLPNIPEYSGDADKQGQFGTRNLDYVWVFANGDGTHELRQDAIIPDLGINFRFVRALTIKGTSLSPATLTLRAGVGLLFPGGSSLNGVFLDLNAGLIAQGTATNPVVFGLHEGTSPWVGIRVSSAANFANIDLTHTTIDRGGLQDNYATIVRDTSLGFSQVQGGNFDNLVITNPAPNSDAVYFENSVVCPTFTNTSLPVPPGGTACGNTGALDCCF